ncbi:MAG: putative DNA binding domain-containing protein [bacterium]|nr:putative DNA binding domain-containing protein [bacterium]
MKQYKQVKTKVSFFIENPKVEALIAFLIVISIVLLSIELFGLAGKNTIKFAIVCGYYLNFIFVIELLLRGYIIGNFRKFFKYHLMDILAVVPPLFQALSVMRVLRLARLVRIIKLVRLAKFVKLAKFMKIFRIHKLGTVVDRHTGVIRGEGFPVELEGCSLDDYLKKQESDVLEFKATLRGDIRKVGGNNSLQKKFVKTIAAFLNSSGGVLLIGVKDNGEVYGIEKDIETLGESKNKDIFQQTLTNIINEKLDKAITRYIKIRFEKKDSKIVCIVKIKKSGEPCFYHEKKEDRHDFYIRIQNMTKRLDTKEAHDYIVKYWGNK